MTHDLSHTGRPVFIVATTEKISAVPIHLQDASRLSDLIPAETHLIDRLMHTSVKAFFQLGGKELSLLPIQIDGSVEDLNSEFCLRVLGKDHGPLLRTGAHALKNFDGLADLLVFPQAPVILGARELAQFYREALDLCERLLPLFLLIDTPCFSNPSRAIAWARALSGAAGAVFYPWISVPDLGFLPISILAAAFLQNMDRRQGLAEPLANRILPSNFVPLKKLQPQEVRDLTAAHVNCVRPMIDDGFAFWGAFTLERSEDAHRFVHYSRALRRLQDAMERTCEPYLMEARTDSTCRKLEFAVGNLMEQAANLGILNTEISGQKPYEVQCNLELGKFSNRDPVLHLNVDLALENPERRIGMRLNL